MCGISANSKNPNPAHPLPIPTPSPPYPIPTPSPPYPLPTPSAPPPHPPKRKEKRFSWTFIFANQTTVFISFTLNFKFRQLSRSIHLTTHIILWKWLKFTKFAIISAMLKGTQQLCQRSTSALKKHAKFSHENFILRNKTKTVSIAYLLS